MLDKMEKIEAPRANLRAIAFQFPPVQQSAQEVFRLRNIKKVYDDNEVLHDISFKVMRGDKVALLGPNGAGKSTLLRILAGVEEPTDGKREEGRNVTIGYFAQHQAEVLDLDRTALQEVLHGLDLQPEGQARQLLGRLLMRGEEVYKPIRVLSGGERSRVALAKFLMKPANTLLLDEPTNHLDLNSRQVLQEALKGYEGTIVVVSHDRPFVNAIAKEAFAVTDGVISEKSEPLTPPQKGKNKGKK
jgi:ATP-binding cassette subfamily F protein 3